MRETEQGRGRTTDSYYGRCRRCVHRCGSSPPSQATEKKKNNASQSQSLPQLHDGTMPTLGQTTCFAFPRVPSMDVSSPFMPGTRQQKVQAQIELNLKSRIQTKKQIQTPSKASPHQHMDSNTVIISNQPCLSHTHIHTHTHTHTPARIQAGSNRKSRGKGESGIVGESDKLITRRCVCVCMCVRVRVCLRVRLFATMLHAILAVERPQRKKNKWGH